VYKIKCKECNASYVTNRILKTRIKEYINHINWNTTQQSLLRIDLNFHEFDWENINILDEEEFLHKRLK